MRLKVGALLEWGYISLFVILLLYLGMGSTMGHELQHEVPVALSASDAFGEVAYTEGIVELGSYEYLPYYVRYGFEDTLGFHMPIYNHIVALFSISSGLEAWDALLFTGFLYSIFALLAVYLLLRDFSRNAALIALPLSIFLYVRNFNIVYIFGIWDLVMATSLMIASVWVLQKFDLKKSWVLFGVLASGVALTHISEAIFLALFTIVFFSLKFFLRKVDFSEIKKLVMAGLISLVLSSYYLVIFRFGYGRGGTSVGIDYRSPSSFDVVFSQFGFFSWVIVLGALIAVFLVATKKWHASLLFSVFMLLIGYTNFLVSFAPRAFQTRHLWPVHLSILLGLVIYFVGKAVVKNWKMVYSVGISFLLAVSVVFAYYDAPRTQGLMDPYHWELFDWVGKNTPINARLLYFYGDIYSQEAVLWNQKRVSYRVKMDDYVNALNNREIRKEYNAAVAAADDAGLLYRKSAFGFGYYSEEINRSEYFGKQSICSFEYLVFDKAGRQQALAQYNMLIANELIKNPSIETAFENRVSVVLRNNNVGGNCIEERSI